MQISNASKIPLVDEWSKPTPEQLLFTNQKNIIMAPLDKLYQVENNKMINCFMINPKKSYNSDDLRNHCCKYLNYFEAYFDSEKEYFTNMAHIKYCIDTIMEYNILNFKHDITRYILQASLFAKTRAMVEHNYSLTLNYKSANNPQLQYTDEHAKVLMQMSILMNMCIPLITHFAYMKRISDIDEFLLDIYDYILYAPVFSHVNIHAKLYETSISNVSKNEKNNAIIWGKQDIRGKDVVTHSMSAVKNIVLNIMPKYAFDQNMVSLNYTSIQKNNTFQITDIAYEYSYIPLSSSKRDGEDNTSEMDKFEANLTKANEAAYIHNKYNCSFVTKSIEDRWGPFDPEEIRYYTDHLKNDNGEIMNGFQKQLVFNLFYKYYGDTSSINAINALDYVMLMIVAKRMLRDNMMAYLPYIIGGKVEKIVTRKSLNKKEEAKMKQSQYYPLVLAKYNNNEKIIKLALGTIATIITSNFSIIDYYDQDLTGKPIVVDIDIIIEEALLYILLI